jgi:hypothetical protein
MTKVLKTLKDRWRSESPLIFKRITRICLGISAMSIAMHMACMGAGAVEPYWWTAIYPYLVGVPAGMAFVGKLTRDNNQGGNKK